MDQNDNMSALVANDHYNKSNAFVHVLTNAVIHDSQTKCMALHS